MDKLITWKTRVGTVRASLQTAPMDKEIDDELLDDAEWLATAAFGPQAEAEHIQAVYERLLANRQMGLWWWSAITVH